jgi:hypothetical protein
MSSKNTFTTHPLIPNSNQYFYEKKYLSIHSEDRDYAKYLSSSEFEITLPQEYLNVASARLYSWSFPANYNVFSVPTYNITMSFKFNDLYNPGALGVSDPLLEGIFAALYSISNSEKDLITQFFVVIEPGFYNPTQMAIELTNKFNEIVTNKIFLFFEIPQNKALYPIAAATFKEYDRFHIVYNSVNQKLWFGNSADRFTLTNDSVYIYEKDYVSQACLRRRELPEYANWGLPAYLGFSRCEAPAYSVDEASIQKYTPEFLDTALPRQKVPRFYYGDTSEGSGDNGYWLLPGAPQATVYFLEAPYKISFMGPPYIYMEIEGMNCLDETSPWNLSEYTIHNNQTNGVVNSAFAKIAIPTTPISQWFDNDMGPYKYWNPPAERISKLKFKFRYHNGQICEFGQFQFSFMLEFNILKPQQERSYSIRNAFDLGQNQSYGSKFV